MLLAFFPSSRIRLHPSEAVTLAPSLCWRMATIKTSPSVVPSGVGMATRGPAASAVLADRKVGWPPPVPPGVVTWAMTDSALTLPAASTALTV